MLTITVDMDFPDLDASKRALGRVHAAAGLDVMQWFKAERMPLRFDGSVAKELHWQDRDPDYDSNKGVRGLSGKPHVWTGHTAAQSRRSEIRISAKKLSLILSNLNRGYGRRRVKASRPNMLGEITSISTPELVSIGELYGAALAAGLTKLWQEQRRRERIE